MRASSLTTFHSWILAEAMRPSMLPDTSRQIPRSIGLPSAGFAAAGRAGGAGLGSSAADSGSATPMASATALAIAARRKERAMWEPPDSIWENAAHGRNGPSRHIRRDSNQFRLE